MEKDTKLAKVDILDQNDNPLASATIITIDGSRLMLHGEGFPLLPGNSAIKAVGYSGDGMLIMEGFISLSMEEQLNLDISGSEMRTDRREYFKVKTNEPATVRFARMPNQRLGFLCSDRIRLRDLSLGGLCFYSNRTYFPDQILRIELDTIGAGLELNIQLLRKVTEQRRIGYRYRYAGRFADADAAQQRILCEHIFKTELINYHNEVE
jgi:hypothetical protein